MKFKSCLCIFLLVIVLTACSSSTNSNLREANNREVQKTKFDQEYILSNLEVNEYKYTHDYIGICSHYVVLTIKNNSGYDIMLEANLTGYDSDKNIIDASRGSILALENGSEGCIYFYLDYEPDTFDYELKVNKPVTPSYLPIQSQLSYKYNLLDGKIILSIDNNSKLNLKDIGGIILAFSENNVVEFATFNSHEVLSHETVHLDEYLFTNSAIDDVKVYFNDILPN